MSTFSIKSGARREPRKAERHDPHSWERKSETLRVCKDCGRCEWHEPGMIATYSGGGGSARSYIWFPGRCIAKPETRVPKATR